MRFSLESPVPTIRLPVRVNTRPHHGLWSIGRRVSDTFLIGSKNTARLSKLFGIASACATCCQVWLLQDMSHIPSDVVNHCLHLFQIVQRWRTVSYLSFWKNGRDCKCFCNCVGWYDGRCCSHTFSWRGNYSCHQEHHWFWMDSVFWLFASPPGDSGW